MSDLVRITSDTINNFYPNRDIPSCLVSNNFFPFICAGQLSRFEDDFYNFTKIYYKPDLQQHSSKSTSSKNIIQSLTFSRTLVKYTFTSGTYFIGKGIILDNAGNVLTCLTLKKESLLDYRQRGNIIDQESPEFSYDNFILFVASELPTKEEHSVFYRRIQKIYLEDCFEKGMEVRFLPSSVIEKNTFATPLNIRFNSITELDFHLRNEVKNFFTASDSIAETQALQINIPPVIFVPPIVPPIVEHATLSAETLSQGIDRLMNGLDTTRNDIFNAVGVPSTYFSYDPTSSNYIGGVDTYSTESLVHITTVEPVIEVDPDIIEL